MGQGADTALEVIKRGGRGNISWEVVPLGYGTGDEALLDVGLALEGEEVGFGMEMSGSARNRCQVRGVVDGHQSMNNLVDQDEADVCSSLFKTAPTELLTYKNV